MSRSSRVVSTKVAVLLASILSACTTTTGSSVTSAPQFHTLLCGDQATGERGLISPFRWSKHDTPETIMQAKERNRDWMSVCAESD